VTVAAGKGGPPLGRKCGTHGYRGWWLMTGTRSTSSSTWFQHMCHSQTNRTNNRRMQPSTQFHQYRLRALHCLGCCWQCCNPQGLKSGRIGSIRRWCLDSDRTGTSHQATPPAATVVAAMVEPVREVETVTAGTTAQCPHGMRHCPKCTLNPGRRTARRGQHRHYSVRPEKPTLQHRRRRAVPSCCRIGERDCCRSTCPRSTTRPQRRSRDR